MTMRHVQASAAKTHLPRLLDDVERGETVVITRHGRPIARLVPEVDKSREEVRAALQEIDRLRKHMPKLSVEEILALRHEGHKY